MTQQTQLSRYAIYLSPPPSSPLWRFASALLGYDAATGEAVAQPPVSGIDADDWRAATADPRLYGFHATLKAPFRLAPGRTAEALHHALKSFTSSLRPFSLPLLEVEAVDMRDDTGFLALLPASRSPELHDLESAAVTSFDSFRHALSEAEIARRNPARLSSRQKDYLERFGYPYVLEEFRPHFSLTGRTGSVQSRKICIAEAIANSLGPVHLDVDALVLFEQLWPGEPFRIAARYGFGDSA
jgi:Protein of unknown function (DUF1045)